MVHYVSGLPAPVSNDNLFHIYCSAELLTTNKTYVSPLGGSLPNFPSDTGELISLVSSDAADTGILRIIGLDKNFTRQVEEVELSGVDPVITTKEFTRINVLSSRSQDAVQGQILAQDVSNTVSYRSLSAESQISEDGVFSIPANRKWQIHQVYGSVIRDSNQNSTAIIDFNYRFVGFPFRRPFRFPVTMSGNSSAHYNNDLPLELNGPVDIYISASSSDVNTTVASRTIGVIKNK